MPQIAVLGANPACQKTLFFNGFTYGDVNRACRMTMFPSGKGVNFCRAAARWGVASGVLFQFTGGENGRFVASGCAAEGIVCRNTPAAGSTRCCMTCLDTVSGTMTELIEPSHAVSAAESTAFLTGFKQELPTVSAVAICGTLPDGSDYDLYHQAAAAAHAAEKMVLFDAWKELTPCLDTGKNILKINRDELRKLTGINDVPCALKALFQRYQLCFAAITDGAAAAYASDGQILYTYTLPAVAPVVNPIGCGDTASAVLLSEIIGGSSPFEAFRTALGAASANCLTEMPGDFDRHKAGEIVGKIGISTEKL